MTSTNRRLLITAGIGSAIALLVCGIGTILFQYQWFINFSSIGWVSWFITLIGLAAFFGTPVLLMLLAWRWEPLAKGWKLILAHWAASTVAAIVGWFLTVTVITGFHSYLLEFFRLTLATPGTYATIGGGAAIIGILDWTFFTRRWQKRSANQAVPLPRNDEQPKP